MILIRPASNDVWTAWGATKTRSAGPAGRDANLLTEAGWMREDRHGSLHARHDGLKRLVVLFKSSRIDIRHIIGEDLHLAFLRQRTGKDGIDGSVHVCSSMLRPFDHVTSQHACHVSRDAANYDCHDPL